MIEKQLKIITKTKKITKIRKMLKNKKYVFIKIKKKKKSLHIQTPNKT